MKMKSAARIFSVMDEGSRKNSKKQSLQLKHRPHPCIVMCGNFNIARRERSNAIGVLPFEPMLLSSQLFQQIVPRPARMNPSGLEKNSMGGAHKPRRNQN